MCRTQSAVEVVPDVAHQLPFRTREVFPRGRLGDTERVGDVRDHAVTVVFVVADRDGGRERVPLTGRQLPEHLVGVELVWARQFAHLDVRHQLHVVARRPDVTDDLRQLVRLVQVDGPPLPAGVDRRPHLVVDPQLRQRLRDTVPLRHVVDKHHVHPPPGQRGQRLCGDDGVGLAKLREERLDPFWLPAQFDDPFPSVTPAGHRRHRLECHARKRRRHVRLGLVVVANPECHLPHPCRCPVGSGVCTPRVSSCHTNNRTGNPK